MVYSDIGLLEEETCRVTTIQSELRSTNQHSEELRKMHIIMVQTQKIREMMQNLGKVTVSVSIMLVETA